MKNFLAFLFFILIAGTLQAQYLPNSAQTFQFMPLFNPAFSGVEPFGDLKFSYRYQWSGFGDNSPKFLNVSYHRRLVQPLDLAYNGLRLSDPTAINPEHLPRSKRMVHGVGGNIFHSQVGVLKSIGGNIDYAIHYPLGKTSRFSVGLSLLIENRKLDVGEVTVRDPDPYYDRLIGGATSQTDLNLRAGVLVYGPRYYVGLSYLPALYTVLAASDLTMTEPFYKGSAQAGFSFPMSADVTLKPAILALLRMNGEVSVDYNVKAFFRKNIWLGMTYRDIESGVVIVGWNFNERLGASYSYEMSLGQFKQFNDGSHELVLGLRLNNFKKYSQYTW